MADSAKTYDDEALAIIGELRSYGFAVVGQSFASGRFLTKDVQRFVEVHPMEQVADFVFLTSPKFNRIRRDLEGGNRSLLLEWLTDWLYLPGDAIPEGETIAARIVQRIQAGEAVTLIPATAVAVTDAFEQIEIGQMTKLCLAALILSVKYAGLRFRIRLKGQRGGRALSLVHIGRYFVPRKLRRYAKK